MTQPRGRRANARAMKLVTRAIAADELIKRLESRLTARGLTPKSVTEGPDVDEAPVDPLSFNLAALERHTNVARPLAPPERKGPTSWAERALVAALGRLLDPLVEHVLSRQVVFNAHVRDSYAQLSAEVMRLREEVESLRSEGAGAKRPSGRQQVTTES